MEVFSYHLWGKSLKKHVLALNCPYMEGLIAVLSVKMDFSKEMYFCFAEQTFFFTFAEII